MNDSEFDAYFALSKEGNLREAYKVLREILANSSRWSQVGDLYVWCADFELSLNNDVGKAHRLIRKARRLGCKFMGSYHGVHGVILCRQGHRAEGIKELERAVELKPSVLHLCWLATALTEAGDKRASFLWQHILSQAPEDCWAHIGMASWAVQSGDRGKALLMLKRAERLNPTPRTYLDIARVYSELGEYRQAIDACLKADRKGEVFKGSLYALIAECYRSLGDTDTGKKYLRWAMRHDPDDEYVKEVCKTYSED